MTNLQSSSSHVKVSDVLAEKRILEALEIMKTSLEDKINHLSLANRRLKRRIFDHYTIFELSRRLNSVLDLNILVSEMLSTLMDELGIDNIAVFLHQDPKQDKLFLLKEMNPESKAPMNHFELSLTGKLSQLLLKEKEPLFLTEIQTQIKGDKIEIEILHRLNCKLCVPLITKNQLVGILILGPKKLDSKFTDSDLEFISILAGQITVAVENAILYETQKSINAELKRAQRQLIQSEKLAAIGQLSASLAHEINNPLGIIKNYLLILSENVENTDLNQHNLKTIKEEVDRIARIVKGLLDFSRPSKEEMVLLDLPSMLKQTLFLVSQDFLNKKIKITTEVPEQLPPVVGSEDQIKQVFLNLLVNARDSMMEGGGGYYPCKRSVTRCRNQIIGYRLWSIGGESRSDF